MKSHGPPEPPWDQYVPGTGVMWGLLGVAGLFVLLLLILSAVAMLF